MRSVLLPFWVQTRRLRRASNASRLVLRTGTLLVVLLLLALLWMHPEERWRQRFHIPLRAELRDESRFGLDVRTDDESMGHNANTKLGTARCNCAQELDTAFSCLKVQSDVLVRVLVTAVEGYRKPWRCQDAGVLLATCYLDQRHGNLSSPALSLATVEQHSLGGHSDPFQALWACEFYLANFLLCIDDLAGGAENGTRSLLGGAGHILGELLVPVARPDMQSRDILRDPQRATSLLYCLLNWHRWVRHMEEDSACVALCQPVETAPSLDTICTDSLCTALFRESRSSPLTLAGLTVPERPTPRACVTWLFDVLAELAVLLDAGEPVTTNVFALSDSTSYGACWPAAQRLAHCMRTNVVEGNGGVLGPTRSCQQLLGDLSECIGGIALRQTAENCVTKDINWAVRCAPMVDLDYHTWFFDAVRDASTAD
ncbi:hypothetical protein F1559_000763 [Cyanidiococcus yangmingshanensis]|uniref:Uncharacterized protein n=1 Tax=Cyanidiococcus yangmingshanensis TaxID=2690220 RepID=A0A7J7IG40_9RHOD|nr:hypothetical protein F1559_000763 [Cyanidiococcus yangmingshanensis]